MNSWRAGSLCGVNGFMNDPCKVMDTVEALFDSIFSCFPSLENHL